MDSNTESTPSAEDRLFTPLTATRRMFFYGTLGLAHLLKRILGLRTEPVLQPATLSTAAYDLMMWGPYPALVSRDDSAVERSSPVKGMVYACLEAHMPRLRSYEGANYRLQEVEVLVDSSSGVDKVTAWTFVWCGSTEELKEGEFQPGEVLGNGPQI
ncbi:hypothetical protein EXIGLDRAFT_768372 [Exidia glandulosa HHB12029]|uniref:Putative gamma-glutamylcyclotransferase n=1 Tax=Exidia glandulosa HHB12029 TaxID=1314781 RepID=A0A165IAW7_EXIGL|nr:hypothetical protein EXIGLDRAFT_768372 [Exidia glandulosa HHB12029]